MRSIDRCGPLQSIGFVRALGGYFASAPHTVEKIDDEQKLHQKSNDGSYRNEGIEAVKVFESIIRIEAVIPSWYSKHTPVVHRPEHHVRRDNRTPEVHLTQRFVHNTTKHLGIPVVNTRQHPKDSCHSHHKVKVSHDKIGVVNLNIKDRVTHKKSGQTTGNKHGNKSDRIEVGAVEPNITSEYGRKPVENLHGRRNGDNHRKR